MRKGRELEGPREESWRWIYGNTGTCIKLG